MLEKKPAFSPSILSVLLAMHGFAQQLKIIANNKEKTFTLKKNPL